MTLTPEELRLGEETTTEEFRYRYQGGPPPPVCSRIRKAQEQARASALLGDDTGALKGDGEDIRGGVA